MVKTLSPQERAAIDAAITEAERRTSAELVVVIAPASDSYQSFILLYGLMLGSAVALGLWALDIIPDFPLLLAAQLTTLSLVSFIPALRHIMLRLVPEHASHPRAARRAYEEYMSVAHHVPASTPIVLLYLSLAEHYVHIVQGRLVRDIVAEGEWNHIVSALTSSITTQGLAKACIGAIESSAALLAPHFPEEHGHPSIPHQLIERTH